MSNCVTTKSPRRMWTDTEDKAQPLFFLNLLSHMLSYNSWITASPYDGVGCAARQKDSQSTEGCTCAKTWLQRLHNRSNSLWISKNMTFFELIKCWFLIIPKSEGWLQEAKKSPGSWYASSLQTSGLPLSRKDVKLQLGVQILGSFRNNVQQFAFHIETLSYMNPNKV